jgi:hypothetical protein
VSGLVATEGRVNVHKNCSYCIHLFEVPAAQPEPFVIGNECKLVLCISEDVFDMDSDPRHERVESSTISRVQVLEHALDVRIDCERSITETF